MDSIAKFLAQPSTTAPAGSSNLHRRTTSPRQRASSFTGGGALSPKRDQLSSHLANLQSSQDRTVGTALFDIDDDDDDDDDGEVNFEPPALSPTNTRPTITSSSSSPPLASASGTQQQKQATAAAVMNLWNKPTSPKASGSSMAATTATQSRRLPGASSFSSAGATTTATTTTRHFQPQQPPSSGAASAAMSFLTGLQQPPPSSSSSTFGAGAGGSSSLAENLCSNCDDEPASVFCKACDARLCITCDGDFHRPRNKQNHHRSPIASPNKSSPSPLTNTNNNLALKWGSNNNNNRPSFSSTSPPSSSSYTRQQQQQHQPPPPSALYNNNNSSSNDRNNNEYRYVHEAYHDYDRYAGGVAVVPDALQHVLQAETIRVSTGDPALSVYDTVVIVTEIFNMYAERFKSMTGVTATSVLAGDSPMHVPHFGSDLSPPLSLPELTLEYFLRLQQTADKAKEHLTYFLESVAAYAARGRGRVHLFGVMIGMVLYEDTAVPKYAHSYMEGSHEAIMCYITVLSLIRSPDMPEITQPHGNGAVSRQRVDSVMRDPRVHDLIDDQGEQMWRDVRAHNIDLDQFMDGVLKCWLRTYEQRVAPLEALFLLADTRCDGLCDASFDLVYNIMHHLDADVDKMVAYEMFMEAQACSYSEQEVVKITGRAPQALLHLSTPISSTSFVRACRRRHLVALNNIQTAEIVTMLQRNWRILKPHVEQRIMAQNNFRVNNETYNLREACDQLQQMLDFYATKYNNNTNNNSSNNRGGSGGGGRLGGGMGGLADIVVAKAVATIQGDDVDIMDCLLTYRKLLYRAAVVRLPSPECASVSMLEHAKMWATASNRWLTDNNGGGGGGGRGEQHMTLPQCGDIITSVLLDMSGKVDQFTTYSPLRTRQAVFGYFVCRNTAPHEYDRFMRSLKHWAEKGGASDVVVMVQYFAVCCGVEVPAESKPIGPTLPDTRKRVDLPVSASSSSSAAAAAGSSWSLLYENTISGRLMWLWLQLMQLAPRANDGSGMHGWKMHSHAVGEFVHHLRSAPGLAGVWSKQFVQAPRLSPLTLFESTTSSSRSNSPSPYGSGNGGRHDQVGVVEVMRVLIKQWMRDYVAACASADKYFMHALRLSSRSRDPAPISFQEFSSLVSRVTREVIGDQRKLRDGSRDRENIPVVVMSDVSAAFLLRAAMDSARVVDGAREWGIVTVPAFVRVCSLAKVLTYEEPRSNLSAHPTDVKRDVVQALLSAPSLSPGGRQQQQQQPLSSRLRARSASPTNHRDRHRSGSSHRHGHHHHHHHRRGDSESDSDGGRHRSRSRSRRHSRSRSASSSSSSSSGASRSSSESSWSGSDSQHRRRRRKHRHRARSNTSPHRHRRHRHRHGRHHDDKNDRTAGPMTKTEERAAARQRLYAGVNNAAAKKRLQALNARKMHERYGSSGGTAGRARSAALHTRRSPMPPTGKRRGGGGGGHGDDNDDEEVDRDWLQRDIDRLDRASRRRRRHADLRLEENSDVLAGVAPPQSYRYVAAHEKTLREKLEADDHFREHGYSLPPVLVTARKRVGDPTTVELHSLTEACRLLELERARQVTKETEFEQELEHYRQRETALRHEVTALEDNALQLQHQLREQMENSTKTSYRQLVASGMELKASFMDEKRLAEMQQEMKNMEMLIQGLNKENERLVADKRKLQQQQQASSTAANRVATPAQRTPPRSPVARMSEMQEDLKRLERHKDEELANMRRKLQWYAENQGMIDDYETKIQNQQREIHSLELQVQQLQQQVDPRHKKRSIRTTTAGGTTMSSSAAAEKIKRLEEEVAALRSRQPDSVHNLVRAARPSANESETVRALQAEVDELRKQLRQKDDEVIRRVRSLRQQHEQVKLMYERRIDSLRHGGTGTGGDDDGTGGGGGGGATTTVAQLQKQIRQLRESYQRHIRRLESAQGSTGGVVKTGRRRVSSAATTASAGGAGVTRTTASATAKRKKKPLGLSLIDGGGGVGGGGNGMVNDELVASLRAHIVHLDNEKVEFKLLYEQAVQEQRQLEIRWNLAQKEKNRLIEENIDLQHRLNMAKLTPGQAHYQELLEEVSRLERVQKRREEEFRELTQQMTAKVGDREKMWLARIAEKDAKIAQFREQLDDFLRTATTAATTQHHHYGA